MTKTSSPTTSRTSTASRSAIFEAGPAVAAPDLPPRRRRGSDDAAATVRCLRRIAIEDALLPAPTTSTCGKLAARAPSARSGNATFGRETPVDAAEDDENQRLTNPGAGRKRSRRGSAVRRRNPQRCSRSFRAARAVAAAEAGGEVSNSQIGTENSRVSASSLISRRLEAGSAPWRST